MAAETRDAMARKGLSTEILSGGSTGTWQIDTALPELTEMQAGSFVLMDMAYRRAGVDFRQGITVLATVVSANHENFVSVDAGTKSFSTDRGYGPEAVNLPGSGYRWGGDEFGYVDVDDPATRPCLGDKLEFIPPHCDPTVNLYTSIYACRGNQVEAVWPLKCFSAGLVTGLNFYHLFEDFGAQANARAEQFFVELRADAGGGETADDLPSGSMPRFSKTNRSCSVTTSPSMPVTSVMRDHAARAVAQAAKPAPAGARRWQSAGESKSAACWSWPAKP